MNYISEKMKRYGTTLVSFLLMFLFTTQWCEARVNKFRLSWREDPSTTMVIGWHQVSGENPTVYLDEFDYGQEYRRYRFSKKPNRVVKAKGMNNHFVRLRGLKPGTVYYFVVVDSEGSSRRWSFQTAPAFSNERLSIIAGGDSRNNRAARVEANQLVAKLRPHVVLFSGDMTGGDTPEQWMQWMDDWQHTISRDGRLYPLIIARGNHEESNQVLVDLFDAPNPEMYYALTLGGNLLRVYSLNSMIPAGGNQRSWLERDLLSQNDVIWKVAQYHNTMRPHTLRKPENNESYKHWADLFYSMEVKLAIESDAHVVKTTWPVRPSTEPGSTEGFIRDDENGTVFVGEGGWGAPLRECNDAKPWTRASSSFNQFKWIFVDENSIEVRTIRTSGADRVKPIDPNNIFVAPFGLAIWNPPTGDVVTILKDGADIFASTSTEPDLGEDILAAKEAEMEIQGFAMKPNSGQVAITWTTVNEPGGVRFQVQRSNDQGKNFSTIAEMGGKGAAKNDYSCMDLQTPSGAVAKVEYRILQIFSDGQTKVFQPKREASQDIGNWDSYPKIIPDYATKQVKVAYVLDRPSNIYIRMINPLQREVMGMNLSRQDAGRYLKTVDLSKVPPGRYLLVIKADGRAIKRYRVNHR